MENYLLDKINSPSDLKSLSHAEIEKLCQEIRDFLIEVSSKNGGHLASNLGVTELSVALHRVFDSPSDHIIFDVGHQSYVHKLLTGRKDLFSTLRTTGGLSGFTKMSESVHDAFGAGHSSTSISAALGYAEADRIGFMHMRNVYIMDDGSFEERAHLSSCGSIDMYAVVKALVDAGFDGYVRPDHGRMIWGETGKPGYGLFDRALGAAYINGLFEAAEKAKAAE